MRTDGEELMKGDAGLKGVSAKDVTTAILAYMTNVANEKAAGVRRRDGGPHMRVESFLRRWLEANKVDDDIKTLIDKHFGTELSK